MHIAQNTATSPATPEVLDEWTRCQIEFWRSVAETFGVDVNAVDGALVGHDALSVIDILLPNRSAEERSEVMWALGEFQRRADAEPASSTTRCCATTCQPAA